MIFTLFCSAILFGILALRRTAGWLSSATLVEYQRAVLFRRGHPVRDVGPGRYRVWTGIGKLMVVDARPVQVSYENRAVTLQDGGVAIYSLSGSARVSDVRKALYAARNHDHIPVFVFLCCARYVLNSCTTAEVRTGKDAIVEKIIGRARPRLGNGGFELVSFRLTELSVVEQQTAE
jgi:regulator of protease activity HflC (stomatin/prohibitin superfamily)